MHACYYTKSYFSTVPVSMHQSLMNCYVFTTNLGLFTKGNQRFLLASGQEEILILLNTSLLVLLPAEAYMATCLMAVHKTLKTFVVACFQSHMEMPFLRNLSNLIVRFLSQAGQEVGKQCS